MNQSISQVDYYNYTIPCPPPNLGGGKDAQGCLLSAGFSYNKDANACCKYSCIPPANTPNVGPVGAGVRPGGDTDQYGCKPGSGFSYMAQAGKCCRAQCVKAPM